MSTRTLTNADHGTMIAIEQGSTLTIQLAENSTTGFQWAVQHSDDQIVPIIKDAYVRDQNPSDRPIVGAGGTRILTLEARRAGAVEFQLKYWRAWQGDDSIVETFTVAIQVVDHDATTHSKQIDS